MRNLFGVMPELESKLDAFDPISLGEMDNVNLMNRVDTKFTFRRDQLPHILEEMIPRKIWEGA